MPAKCDKFTIMSSEHDGLVAPHLALLVFIMSLFHTMTIHRSLLISHKHGCEAVESKPIFITTDRLTNFIRLTSPTRSLISCTATTSCASQPNLTTKLGARAMEWPYGWSAIPLISGARATTGGMKRHD